MAVLDEVQSERQKFFDTKRQQAQQQVRSQAQEAQDALTRRFASLGAQGSGAALAASQKAQEAGMAQQRAAEADITGQELQAKQGDIGMKFQAEEAQKAREAQLGEGQKTREFQTLEAQKAREAQLGESDKQRQFQQMLAGQDIGFKRELSTMEQANKLKEMDLAQKQFDIDKVTTEFNKRLAAIQGGIVTDESGMPIMTQAQKNVKDEEQKLKDEFLKNRTKPTLAPGQDAIYDPTEKRWVIVSSTGSTPATSKPKETKSRGGIF